jgi:hypothetical protein
VPPKASLPRRPIGQLHESRLVAASREWISVGQFKEHETDSGPDIALLLSDCYAALDAADPDATLRVMFSRESPIRLGSRWPMGSLRAARLT